jgi:hypothetical protein
MHAASANTEPQIQANGLVRLRAAPDFDIGLKLGKSR